MPRPRAAQPPAPGPRDRVAARRSSLILPAIGLRRLDVAAAVRRRLRGRHTAAARTELGVSRERMAAALAADDRFLADGPAAVCAEMGAPDDRRAALAAARRRPPPG